MAARVRTLPARSPSTRRRTRCPRRTSSVRGFPSPPVGAASSRSAPTSQTTTTTPAGAPIASAGWDRSVTARSLVPPKQVLIAAYAASAWRSAAASIWWPSPARADRGRCRLDPRRLPLLPAVRVPTVTRASARSSVPFLRLGRGSGSTSCRSKNCPGRFSAVRCPSPARERDPRSSTTSGTSTPIGAPASARWRYPPLGRERTRQLYTGMLAVSIPQRTRAVGARHVRLAAAQLAGDPARGRASCRRCARA